MVLSFQMSPGVYFSETNISQYIQTLSSTIVGLIGVAPRGPVNIRILCTSLSQLIATFGYPAAAYPALMAAREFFNAGGSQLWFVRVAREDVMATATVPLVGSGNLTVDAINTGSFFNSLSMSVSNTNPKFTSVSQTLSVIVTSTQSFTITLPNVPIAPNTLLLTTTSNAKVATDDGAGNLVFVSSGYTGWSGTIDYATGVITITVANASAIRSVPITAQSNYYSSFSIQILSSPLNSNGIPTPLIVEQWVNLTPDTLQDDIAKSNFISIAADPDAFLVPGTYNFAGGDDGITNITDADFVGVDFEGEVTGMQLFSAADEIDINVIACPGISSGPVRQALDQICSIARRDCFSPVDPYPDDTKQSVVDWANATGIYPDIGVLNSTYLGIYFPWYTSFNNVTNNLELTPPSAAVLGALAQSDYYQAPAGPNRGVLLNCLSTAVVLGQGDRDYLYANRINPIGNMSGLGIMILGQKTSTLIPSALDRVKGRITLMRIEKAIVTVLRSLVMEDDDSSTWQRAINIAQPYLTGLVNTSRLLRGIFQCDADTNTTDLENENVLAANVILTLVPTAEQIMVNFVVTAVGSTITEIPL